MQARTPSLSLPGFRRKGWSPPRAYVVTFVTFRARRAREGDSRDSTFLPVHRSGVTWPNALAMGSSHD